MLSLSSTATDWVFWAYHEEPLSLLWKPDDSIQNIPNQVRSFKW